MICHGALASHAPGGVGEVHTFHTQAPPPLSHAGQLASCILHGNGSCNMSMQSCDTSPEGTARGNHCTTHHFVLPSTTAWNHKVFLFLSLQFAASKRGCHCRYGPEIPLLLGTGVNMAVPLQAHPGQQPQLSQPFVCKTMHYWCGKLKHSLLLSHSIKHAQPSTPHTPACPAR